MSITATGDLWWKDAIIYGVDVKTFVDSDTDGVGDLAGLTRRLEYLRELGVTCLWLMPVFPSPWRDDGYDVRDYYSVDPRLGTLGDFVELVRTAHALGLRVLLDLVLNHTSDTHPWFVDARSGPGSRFRDYYVWADQPPPRQDEVVFPGEQESVWTRDERSGQWYFHRYFGFQPDLNIANPVVRDEMNRILGFWLELGVDGFRIDSLPFLIEKDGVKAGGDADGHDPHGYLRELRAFLGRRRGDAVFVGEANVPVPEQRRYFGDPDTPFDVSQAHMLFDFALQAAVWLALARGETGPIRRALRQRPRIPPECQYVVFVRHHDELTVEKVLSAEEAREVFDAFDPEGHARIYGRGLRRRLAPLLDGDPARIRLALSLLFSLPGTPILLYGDEIGLGDDLSLPGRIAVRVPMQWDDRDGAGFSAAPPGRLIRQIRRGGRYGYARVNATVQDADPNSGLAFTKRLIGLRRRCPEIGHGNWSLLDAGDPAVLAVRYDWEGGTVVVVHNLGAVPVEARLDVGVDGGEPVQFILAGPDTEAATPGEQGGGKLAAPIPLEGYGTCWLRAIR
jgi:trehalose synthase